MRDIRDIIEELHRHPDYIVGDIFTIHDVLETIQDEVNDELNDAMYFQEDGTMDYELNADELTDADRKAIQDYMENVLDQIWKHVDGVYPSYNNLPDLRKKIDLSLIHI